MHNIELGYFVYKYAVCPKISRTHPMRKELRIKMKIFTYLYSKTHFFTMNIIVIKTLPEICLCNVCQIVCRSRENVGNAVKEGPL